MFNRVLYTDEPKFEIFGTKRRQCVRRRNGEASQPECLNPTIKHGGGSLQVWDCLASSGVGNLIKIEGRLTGERYVDILRHHAVSSGMRLKDHNLILQQGNDPKIVPEWQKII